MRKVFIWGLILMFFMALPQFIDSAEAGKDKWKTRKLIKNGQLNTSYWSTSTEVDGGAPIVHWSVTPDEKYIQFVHQAGMQDISAWLRLNSANECIKGIEVEVKMGNDLAGSIRARIGATAGAYGPFKEYAWTQMAVRSRVPEDGGDRLQAMMSVLMHTAEADWDWSQFYEPVYTQFNHPEEVDGNTYRIRMIVDRGKKMVHYEVVGYGKTTYKMPEKIWPGWECFWGIGTRTNNAEGYGTVQFGNNVRVLYDGNCKPDKSRPKMTRTWPKNNEKDVEVDLDGGKIRFNEAMNAWPAYCEDGSCCPELQEKDAVTGAWVPQDKLCQVEYDETKDFIFYKPDGAGDLDPNTWYKIVVPKDFFFNLAGKGNSGFSFKFKTGNSPL